MGKAERRGRLERELYARILEWMQVHEADPTSETTVAYLCERFPQYGRLKRGQFARTVEDMLKAIQSERPPLGELSDDDDEAEVAVDHDSNVLNSSMRSFYSQDEAKPDRRVKRPKRRPSDSAVKVTYGDIGGMTDVLQEIRELVEPVLLHPELYEHLGVHPPTGILLHGPPGCGKTMLARAVANELDVEFMHISAPEVVSGMSGESEAKIRQLFSSAQKHAPCLVFIDEVDCITPKRENAGKEMERRIVGQLLTCMESLSSAGAPVIVMGATNRPDALDPALRRAGRFDREISIGIPSESSRESILRVLTRRMRLEGSIDVKVLARRTAGYVGADLASLCKEAAVLAVKRVFTGSSTSSIPERVLTSDVLRRQRDRLTPEQLEPLCVIADDFDRALKVVQPSSKREGFATTPDVTWADIGALEELSRELRFAIVLPILKPDVFASFNLGTPSGVLLFGPPGCGKTLVAKAVAHESGASFISIKGPELLNKFVGESERSVRQVFQRARASAPCIIFFDELDALCPRRGNGRQSDAVSERVVNTLLTEMDGIDSRRYVFVIAATNRPDMIDAAMLRPGRLDKLLYVQLPSPDDRVAILASHTRSVPLAPNVDITAIAFDARCNGFSGADIAALTREASLCALKRHLDGQMSDGCPTWVTADDFNHAITRVFPSVSEASQRQYDRMQRVLRKSRSRMEQDPELAESGTAGAPAAASE